MKITNDKKKIMNNQLQWWREISKENKEFYYISKHHLEAVFYFVKLFEIDIEGDNCFNFRLKEGKNE